MITEQHELLSARFADNDRKNILILWIDPETKEIAEEIIESKQSDSSFQHLMTLTNLESVHEQTREYFIEQQKQFKETVKKIAEEEGLLVSEDNFNNQKSKIFLREVSKIFTNDLTDEELFSLKLAVFEMPELKESKDRKKKSDLRKAKTGPEVMKAAFAFMVDSVE